MEHLADDVFEALKEAAGMGFDGILLDPDSGEIIGLSPIRLGPEIDQELLRSELLQLFEAVQH